MSCSHERIYQALPTLLYYKRWKGGQDLGMRLHTHTRSTHRHTQHTHTHTHTPAGFDSLFHNCSTVVHTHYVLWVSLMICIDNVVSPPAFKSPFFQLGVWLASKRRKRFLLPSQQGIILYYDVIVSKVTKLPLIQR